MTESYRALCSDFYVNQKFAMKMDLPKTRESVLDLFERARKQFPAMGSFRRFREELALESPQSDTPHRWLALKGNNVRTGTVNPGTMPEAYALHLFILETAPFFLNISPLDVDFIELLYGFDILAGGNHDAVVFEALFAGSPLATMLEVPGATPIECQPVVGISLPGRDDVHAHVEVKTHPTPQAGARRDDDAGPQPISVYLTLRRFGSIGEVKDLPRIFRDLAVKGEELLESRVVPKLLVPIREAAGLGHG
ncbi:MAG: hypothetical protein HRU70_02935 [Phycisphaeraceae bacterium]|nr:MAG: hypothetical protein HRU70_02935 [Phycisphaeraceae bacterium]